MTYNPTTWQDRVVQNPNTYTETTNADGTITLTPAPGTVTQQGTPLSAANLNNLETQYQESILDGGAAYGVDTSTTANTITATVSPAPTAYTDGYSVRVKVANTTTGATTLNVNGLGAVGVNNADGTPVGNGDLMAGVPRIFTYVAAQTPFFVASGSGGLSASGNATPAEVLESVTFTSEGGRAQAGTMPNKGNSTVYPGSTLYGFYNNAPVGGYKYASGTNATIAATSALNLGSNTGSALQITGLSFQPSLIYARLAPVGSGGTEYTEVRIYSAADNGFAYNGGTSYIPEDWYVKMSGSTTYEQQGFVGSPPTWYVYNGGFNLMVWDPGNYFWEAFG